MKLEPKAKPVKIRLVDNRGFEYDSFETLKNHFDIGELEKTENLEYTLPKWLRQIGKNDLADKVTESLKGGKKITEASAQDILDFYLLFFKPYMEVKETYEFVDLIEHWINCNAQDTIRRYLKLDVKIHSDNFQAFKQAYHNCSDIDSDVKSKIISWNKFQICDDPEMLFESGRLWFEIHPERKDDDNSYTEALDKIQLSANKGWKAATDYLEEYKKKLLLDVISMLKINRVNVSAMKNWIKRYCDNTTVNPPKRRLSDKEQKIVDFVCKCKQIESQHKIKDKVDKAESLFGNVNATDNLTKEKKFVLAAIYVYDDRKNSTFSYDTKARKKTLTLLRENLDYVPALALLYYYRFYSSLTQKEKEEMSILEKHADLKGFVNKPWTFQITHVLNHLFDYNNEI